MKETESKDNFGKLPLPPTDIPFINQLIPNPYNNKTVKEIRSGFSIITNEDHRFFVAVHKELAEKDLTARALHFATEKESDFYYYGGISCAIPLCELSLKYPEINDFVLNRDSLIQTIVTKAPNYAEYWNIEHAKPGQEIKPNGSMPMMFMQEHYDYEAENTREAVTDFVQEDNGFEQSDEELEIGG